MAPTSLLVANRGEIAVRILRAASAAGMRTVAIYAEDEAGALHAHQADEAMPLRGSGVAAYLDGDQIIALARSSGCDAIHPGYGFLSENAQFAQRCLDAGLLFIGPRVEILELFGDKVRARRVAAEAGVPVLPGTDAATSVFEAKQFLAALDEGSAMIIKAVAGGGGRGVRIVETLGELEDAYARCQSEARAAFGNGDLYVEELVRAARHVEVQIAGDDSGEVVQLGERDCTIQRRHQKLIEIAPSPGLPPRLRERIAEAAVTLARTVRYDNLGTMEFLVEATALRDDSRFAFIEANPRLQVEHTVTEQVTGLDLVRIQLDLSAGKTLEELGIRQQDAPAPRGYAIQVRVNMETMTADGNAMPSGGLLTVFDPPNGPGVRVDTFGYTGYRTSPRYDSLLAKVIAHTGRPDFEDALNRCLRALSEFRIEGISTNIAFLTALLQSEEFRLGEVTTRFVDEHAGRLLAAAATEPARRYVAVQPATVADRPPVPVIAGAQLGSSDPLAVLTYGKSAGADIVQRRSETEALSGIDGNSDGTVTVETPLQGTVVAIEVREGDAVRGGQTLVIMEAMKMEHEIKAPCGGLVQRVAVSVGDTLYQGAPLLFVQEIETEGGEAGADEQVDLDYIRPDLRIVLDRRERSRDAARPGSVARRHGTGHQTARENIAQLFDDGSFIEYGPLVVANRHSRMSMDELIDRTPADGMIIGIGTVNGDTFDDPDSRVGLICYDYMVLAGTQGNRNHQKTDRMIDIAEASRMPVVLFAEGGGGRPGDDNTGGSGSHTFSRFAQLSGLVPVVGITSGRCFAGNASLLGCCDVIIATADSNIGMGGPAMIEGGGLGVFAPEEIGPMSVQVLSGVVDIAVSDEAEAVQVARKYLSYFQGPLKSWEAPDQRLMRRIIPENRLRAYDVRKVIETLGDIGSMLELRPKFGIGMLTALVRVEGRPLGVIANNPMHLGGAIDSDGSDKGARFMQLCDAFDIPLLYLCDTPGIMVGPEIEQTALVRHSSRMFLTGANLSVPFFTVVLRKAYGLGAIAMAGGSYKVPYFSVSWPTGEFYGMGIEGSVKLGFRDQLAAIEDPLERKRTFDEMVERAYERSRAVNSATHFGVDDAIDPAETRWWVASLLRSIRPVPPRSSKKRPAIDAW